MNVKNTLTQSWSKTKNAFATIGGWFARHWKPFAIGGGVLVAAAVTSWFFIPAPKAQGALKGHEVEIYRNAVIRVVFDSRMDHKSVEDAFKISPVVGGKFSWQDNQMTFTPDQHLTKGETYEVTVDERAKNLFFKSLQTPYRQTFKVLDYPEAAVVAPVNDSVIMQDQILTVIFDHPIRNLTGKLDVPDMLKIEPKVNGKYNWLGTSGFEFIPEGDGWPAATKFTVTIPKGTKTADGGSTIEDYVWSFSTPNLIVNLQSQREHQPLKSSIDLSFNYKVDPQQIKNAITLKVNDVDADKNDYTFENAEGDKTVVLIKRKNGYELGKSYKIALEPGFTAGLGELGLKDKFEETITTDELGFRISATCPDNNETTDPRSSIAIRVNNPMDRDTLEKSVKITPTPESLEINADGWSDDGRCRMYSYDGRMIGISARWNPSTKYTVTIKQTLTDIYGQKLEAGKTYSFTTNPFRPSAEVSSYGIYGVLASHLPRLYQVRTLNLKQPIQVTLKSGSFSEFLSDKEFKGSVNVTKAFDTNGTLNKYKIVDLDLDQIADQKLPNGFYDLSIPIPELGERWYDRDRKLVVMDTALTMKRDRQGKILIWATDMKSGEVVADLPVEIWQGESKQKIAAGKTDKQGLATMDVSTEYSDYQLTAYASDGNRLGISDMSWQDGISPWNYGLELNYRRNTTYHIGYVYTDRRIYRPDQLVYFKGVIRLDRDAVLGLPTAKEAEVTVTDAEGNEVLKQNLTLNAYGTFNGQIQLQKSMPLGQYMVRARIVDDPAEAPDISGFFDVREYRKPDFKVDVNQPQGLLTAGQTVKVPVHAEYYQGMPLKGVKANYSISRTKLYFNPRPDEWYSYGSEDDYYCYWYCRAENNYENPITGTITLDDQGNGTIEFPANLTDYKTGANYMVDVTVVDVNQRMVSNRLEFPVHKGEFYVGLRPNYDAGWNAPDAKFDLLTVDTEGKAKSNVSVSVELNKRTWANVKKTNTDGTTYWEYQSTDKLLDAKNLTTDGEGKASISFSPKDDGEYVAVAKTRDARGNLIQSSVLRYVYRGDGYTTRVSDDHQMKIVQSKASYDVGDTASLAVQTPYAGTKALVTVERNGIRDVRVIDLGTKNNIVEVPIKDDSTPNIYVSILAVKGGGVDGIPEFRLGYANLQVNTTKKILNLEVTPDKPNYKPGDKVTLNIRAKRTDGSPAQAEVSIAVVDERVIALLGSIDKNILGKFWFPRSIGVTTAQSLTMLVKKVFFSTTEGGAGGKGDNGVVPPVRGNFKDTAYWNATVETNADGTATVSFDLPDNLTSWNILAIGETKDTVVGNAEAKIVTRKDLMVEPLLPRIMRHEDTSTVGATVMNATNAPIDAKITLKTEGVTADSPLTKTVNIPAMDRRIVNWQVKVPKNGDKSTISIWAQGGAYEDGFKQEVLLLDYSVPEIVSASGILEKNVTETLEMPEGVMPDIGDVRVAVQPNVGSSMRNGLDYLVKFPYGCSEQKTSGMLGNLIYRELAKEKVVLSDQAKMDASDFNIKETIVYLSSVQRQDGGWGFWSESDYSYGHLTGYVFWGLTQAEKAGYQVDSKVMDKATEYLRNALAYGNTDSNYNSLSYNEKAQILFMLSERDTKELSGYAATLYEHRDDLSHFSKAFLAMAYANIEKDSSSAKSAKLMGDIKNDVMYLNPSTAYVKEDEGYGWFMSTDERSTGIYLQALMKLDPKNQDADRVVRWLMQQKKDGYWGTTQSTSMVLLGLVQYVRANPVDDRQAQVSLFLDNDLKGKLDFKQGDVSDEQSKTFSLSELSKNGSIHQFGLEKDSDKRWFYDINMKVYREISDIQSFENGFTLVADVYAMDDKKRERPLAQVSQGDTVRVHMKLLVPKKHQYVALEYHLPSGLEAVDMSLKTSPQNLAGQELQCAPSYWGGQTCMQQGGWEWDWWWENVWKHIEFRDDRVFLFSDSLEPGVYEYDFVAQAMTPGEYRVPPARVYEFYNPQANAHNEGKMLKVVTK